MAAPVVGVMRRYVHVDGLTAEHAGIAHQRIGKNQRRLRVATTDINTAVKARLPHAQRDHALSVCCRDQQARQTEQQQGEQAFHVAFPERYARITHGLLPGLHA